MISQNIGQRYSKALFNLSPSEDNLKVRSAILKFLAAMIKKTPQISTFFHSPHISKADKKGIIQSALKESEDEIMSSFLSLLIEKGHFKLIPEISDTFKTMADGKLGVAEGHLTTAMPLDQALMDRLKTTLQKILHKKVVLSVTNDPKLLGGGTLFIDNKLADFSLKGKLSRMENHLLTQRI